MSQEQRSQDFRAQPSPPNPSRKRPLSERRIQANRKNALRSTGPKTERGKRTVARNAIKHGLLAREVVITTGDGEESPEEFHDLVEQLCEHYEPVGVVEESFVETIAICLWRKARVVRAENGEIRKRLDTLAVDRAFRSSDKANLDLLLSQMAPDIYRPGNPADQQVSTRERWSAKQGDQRTLREHPAGLAYLSVVLKTARSEMASDGYLSEAIRERIATAFGLWDYQFALIGANAGPPEAKKEKPISEKPVDQQTDYQRAAVVILLNIA